VRSAPAVPTWNLLVTSIEGQRDALRAELMPLARFRRGGYPNVLVATVDDPARFIDTLGEVYAASDRLRAALGKAIPIDRTLRLDDPAGFLDSMTAALEPLVDRLLGATFFVRICRRGHRGTIDSTGAERELGARLVDTLQRRGESPHVRFTDPDVVVLIETLRDEVGIALIDRALRTRHSFVRAR